MSNSSLTPEQIEKRMEKIEALMKKQKAMSHKMEILLLTSDISSFIDDCTYGSIEFNKAEALYNELHKKCMDLFEKDPVQMTNIIVGLNVDFAEICTNEFMMDTAKGILDKSQMLIENSLNNYGGDYDLSYAKVKMAMGRFFVITDVLTEAEDSYTEAVKRFEILCNNNPSCASDYASCNIELAEIELVLDKKENALVCLNNARPYCFSIIDGKKLILTPLLERIENNLSTIYLSENDYVNAEDHLTEDVSLLKEIIRFTQADINDPAPNCYSSLTEALEKLADVHIKLNNPQKALQSLKEALPLQEKLFENNKDKNVVTLALIHHNFALAYEMIGDNNAAHEEFSKVLPLLKIGEKRWEMYDLKYKFRNGFYFNLLSK